jgi:hypothetical protein
MHVADHFHPMEVAAGVRRLAQGHRHWLFRWYPPALRFAPAAGWTGAVFVTEARMSFDLGGINWLAVVVGTAIYFVLGALWYSPLLLGRQWQRSIGWDPNRTPPQMSVATYVVPLIGYFVMAVATAMIAIATGADGFGDGIVLGLVIGIGYLAMHSLVDATFDPNKPQPWTWFAINSSYHALGILVVAVLVSIW